jgi:hypothetical protein
MACVHEGQKLHSKLQMNAGAVWGSVAWQRSHSGFMASMKSAYESAPGKCGKKKR